MRYCPSALSSGFLRVGPRAYPTQDGHTGNRQEFCAPKRGRQDWEGGGGEVGFAFLGINLQIPLPRVTHTSPAPVDKSSDSLERVTPSGQT